MENNTFSAAGSVTRRPNLFWFPDAQVEFNFIINIPEGCACWDKPQWWEKLESIDV